MSSLSINFNAYFKDEEKWLILRMSTRRNYRSKPTRRDLLRASMTLWDESEGEFFTDYHNGQMDFIIYIRAKDKIRFQHIKTQLQLKYRKNVYNHFIFQSFMENNLKNKERFIEILTEVINQR